MNPQDELFDTIENYLNEGMSKQERIAFEEKIAQNNALANKVREVRAANEAIYYASLAELKNTIGQDLKNIKYKEPTNWKKIGTISAISVALIVSTTTYIVSTHKSGPSTNKTNTNSNSVRPSTLTVQEQESTTSGKSSIEVSGLSKAVIKKESSEALRINDLTKPESIKADTVTGNAITEHRTLPSENKKQSGQSESTVKKVEAPAFIENKTLCDKSFKIHTEASCKEKETGSILVVSDGAYTYTYQLDIQSKTGSKSLFSNLSPGVYDLAVTYGKECAYTKKVIVAEKWCAMNDAYSFNPDYNEKWKPVYETGTTGTILIYDRQGKEIYSLPFGSGNEEWIGNDKQGMAASIGVYVAIINYSDGRKEKVELTIVR